MKTISELHLKYTKEYEFLQYMSPEERKEYNENENMQRQILFDGKRGNLGIIAAEDIYNEEYKDKYITHWTCPSCQKYMWFVERGSAHRVFCNACVEACKKGWMPNARRINAEFDFINGCDSMAKFLYPSRVN